MARNWSKHSSDGGGRHVTEIASQGTVRRMLKPRDPALGLVLLLVLLIVYGSIAALFSKPSVVKPRPNQEATDEPNPGPKERPLEGGFFDKYSEAITAFATIFIAGFTFTLWRSTRSQAILTRESITLGRDEFNATHRPRIVVQRISAFGDGRNREPAFVEFEIVNSGDSVAVVTEFIGEIYVQGANVAFQPSLRPRWRHFPTDLRLVIGQRHSLKAICPSTWFDYGNFSRQIRTGEPHDNIRMYAIGRVTYIDNDRVTRHTGFCREYSQSTGMWSTVEKSEYEYAY